MAIDYRLASTAIKNAMHQAKTAVSGGIESLLGENYMRQPELAFAGGPNQRLYNKQDASKALDVYLRNSDRATTPVTDVPRAKFFVGQLYG